jgi:hypothetical protein
MARFTGPEGVFHQGQFLIPTVDNLCVSRLDRKIALKGVAAFERCYLSDILIVHLDFDASIGGRHGH